MEDVLTELPPPSRFFLEDLNNFVSPSSQPSSPLLVFKHQSQRPVPGLLIVALSPTPLFLFHHFSSKTLIGTLILPEISLAGISVTPSLVDQTCNIYALDADSSVLLVAVQFSVRSDRTYELARRLIHDIRPTKVLILGSLQAENFRAKLSADEIAIFKLETGVQRTDEEGPLVRRVSYFPSGSVIDGLGAAILARCEIERIKCTLCIIWPHSGRDAILQVKSLLEEVLSGTDFSTALAMYKPCDLQAVNELYT